MLECTLLLLQIVLHFLVSSAYALLILWGVFHFRKEVKELFVACTSVFRGKKKEGEVSVDSPEKES